MNKLKKAFAVLLAVSAIGGGVAVPASAEELIPMEENITSLASYDAKYDIDMNGVVDIADALTLNQYLLGMLYEPNYNRLDVNENQIVDSADVDCVLGYLVNDVPEQTFISRTYTGSKVNNVEVAFPSVSGATLDPDATSFTSRGYIKLNYTSGQISSYNLTPRNTPVSTNQNGDSINGIVDGSDNRYSTTLPENTGIVELKRGTNIITGFIVGNHQIATAAHCVFNDASKQFYTDVSIYTYSPTGNPTTNKLHPVEVHIPNDYTIDYDNNFTVLEEKNRQIFYDRSIYDYALITVSDDLSNFPHFSIGTTYNLSANKWATTPLFVTGCPNWVNGGGNYSHKLYSQMGNVMHPAGDGYDFHMDRLLYHNVDTSGGNSGSPIYTITKGSKNGSTYYVYTALSLVSGGCASDSHGSAHNLGARFTKYHQQFYLNNPNAVYVDNTQ